MSFFLDKAACFLALVQGNHNSCCEWRRRPFLNLWVAFTMFPRPWIYYYWCSQLVKAGLSRSEDDLRLLAESIDIYHIADKTFIHSTLDGIAKPKIIPTGDDTRYEAISSAQKRKDQRAHADGIMVNFCIDLSGSSCNGYWLVTNTEHL